MNRRITTMLMVTVLVLASVSFTAIAGHAQMKSTSKVAAGAKAKRGKAKRSKQVKGVRVKFAGVSQATAAYSPLAVGAPALAAMAAPLSTPDYFGIPNWANSPLPQLDSVTSAVIPGTGMRKFVDTLPGLCGQPGATNTLGQCIPVAQPDRATFPNSDFYRIGLKEYSQRMHSDLPATNLRGYVDLSASTTPQYLGPLIIALRNRPVRVLFQNQIATDLNIPVDTTYMGAGLVNSGGRNQMASEKRSTLHLHGGNTPWISDGTTHQWITPAGGDGQASQLGFAKGFSFQNVPDMVGAGKPIAAPSLTDGMATFYWTNQQSGRLMFYHDHAYGITRLNVYAGEAAGYLLVDPVQEDALASASVPGTLGASSDLAHVIPLIIQDKTFVPDNGAAGGQLAATDPTWDVAGLGGFGSLWFPHVYMPNQNPATDTGSNDFGRWDYGPWFWPPQDPSTFVAQGQPRSCTSIAFPGLTLSCPGTPNPSGTPEAFLDTPVINGTAYPVLHVAPAAYRFQMLSAGNDRTWNLGLYVAEPLSISITNPGSGYTSAPTVAFIPSCASAVATVSTGSVESVTVNTLGNYSLAPLVSFSGGGGGGATAFATIDPSTGALTGITVTSGGNGYSSAPAVILTNAPGETLGGGGTATATISSGSIIAITPTSASTCTSAPEITISGGGGTGAAAIASVNTEVKMVDAVPHNGASTPPVCSGSQPMAGGGLVAALVDGNGNPLNGTGLPASCWPSTWPTDGRDGGVPDPATAGPPFVQIGTEGGLLPSPAVIPSTPMGFEYNRRSITVLNVFSHGLLLGPAERADVVVDFSNYAGKTLILYNDGPAPVPAFDPRADYYTGDADQSSTGGAPTTMAGYGPNTRTIMQVVVDQSAPNTTAFSLASLRSALPGIFSQTQDTPVIPEQAYGAASNKYIRIQDTSAAGFYGGSIGGLTLTSGGANYSQTPTVSITGGGGSGATATASLASRSVASLALTSGGAGYTSAPNVALTGGGGTGATATAALAPTSVAGFTVTAGGSGYTSAPTVTVAVPPCTLGTTGCVRATATATIRTSGQRNVTGLTLTNPGAGYTNVPSVTFSGGGGTGAAATARLAGAAVGSVTLGTGGSNYSSTPTVAFSGGGGSGAAATATLSSVAVASVTLTNGGTGYSSAPTVAIVNAAGDTTGAGAVVAAVAPVNPIKPKAIQELFTLDYGRMNATLGVELPFTNFLTQTTIPYGYADPPTEIFKDGETQLWKITHNGVDTHFIHFHLFNVQVVNRVGWDGAIKAPDPNELSWKDTVRMNPLEDIVVALRPLKQTGLPWDLPNSIRPLDVTMPVGGSMTNEFTDIDPANQPAPVTNDLTNFGWEYVWHCHILGHEENDMMRAMVMAVSPAAPSGVTATPGGSGNKALVALTWTDNSANETGFTIQRATNSGFTTGVTTVGTVGANVKAFTDNTVAKKTTYYYRVIANNMVGYTKTYAAPAVGYPHFSADSGAAFSAAVTTN